MRRAAKFNVPNCIVAGCIRYCSAASPGFCNRCWGMADEGERAQLLFARHAPFWKRSGWDDEPDTFAIHAAPGDDALAVQINTFGGGTYATAAVVCTIDGKKEYEVTWGGFMADFEARTTQELLARRIADRRAGRRFAEAGDPLC